MMQELRRGKVKLLKMVQNIKKKISALRKNSWFFKMFRKNNKQDSVTACEIVTRITLFIELFASELKTHFLKNDRRRKELLDFFPLDEACNCHSIWVCGGMLRKALEEKILKMSSFEKKM